jgi:hypothetical protein
VLFILGFLALQKGDLEWWLHLLALVPALQLVHFLLSGRAETRPEKRSGAEFKIEGKSKFSGASAEVC